MALFLRLLAEYGTGKQHDDAQHEEDLGEHTEGNTDGYSCGSQSADIRSSDYERSGHSELGSLWQEQETCLSESLCAQAIATDTVATAHTLCRQDI